MNSYILKLALFLSFFILNGCADSDNSPQSSSNVSDASQSYYDYLNTGKFVERVEAQPQFPPSGELFNENAALFRFAPAKISAKQSSMASPLISDFAIYTPTIPSGKKVALTVSDPISNFTSSIPSFKKQDIIPTACSGLYSDALRNCLDDLGIFSAPENDHISMHDPKSLNIQIGGEIENKIVKKNIDSVIAQITPNDRTDLITRLNDFTKDDPAHNYIDMLTFNPFDASGYSLTSVVVTDNSSSDTNGDGVLEQHSTMISELVKPINYKRNVSQSLDACMVKYRGGTVDDRYVLKLSTYIHLDNLKSQRKVIPSTIEAANEDSIDIKGALKEYESSLDTMGVNQAIDANIIKAIYSSPNILPATATEYSLMFQIAPEQISGEYSQVIASIANANDNACQELVEQHINARTAMMSGQSATNSSLQKSAAPSLTVFYQVPVTYNHQTAAKFAEAILGEVSGTVDNVPLRDYCMVDGNGEKVAIIDPATGLLIPACEKLEQKALSKSVMLTKEGACKGNKNEWWSYYPGLIRSPRFGGGVQYILSEWMIHNQVGDYKNIHLYQSAWKSTFQVAVRAAKIVAATYFQGQLTSERFAEAAAPDILFVVDAVMGYTAKILKTADFELAKHRFKLPSEVTHFLAQKTGRAASDTGSKKAGYAAFLIKLQSESKYKTKKGKFLGFMIERFTDSVAQFIDVEVVGWQDLSDGSHHGCFKFD